MLSYGRVTAELSRIARRARFKPFQGSVDQVCLISTGFPNYASSKNKKPTKPPGTTIKAEECVPPPKPPHRDPPIEKPTPSECAPKDAKASSSPDACFKPNAGYGKGPGDCKEDTFITRNWKRLLAAFIVGAVILISQQRYKPKPVDDPCPKKKDKKKSGAKARFPPNSKKMPSEVPYLLIGGGTASFSAFRSIKATDPKAKVLVISEELDIPYMRPPLSKELWYSKEVRPITNLKNGPETITFKQWNGTQRSLFYEPNEFYTNVSELMERDKGGVAIARGWKVAKIDVMKRIATLDDGFEIKYEKCLIATGSVPKNLPVFETAEDEVNQKIILFRTKEDFLALENRLKCDDIKNVVIIGGGFLGSELACSLKRNLDKFGKQFLITQLYKEKHVMAQILPEYLSEWTTKKVENEGVNLISNAEVKDFRMKSGQLQLMLTNGDTINADQIIVAVGADANTELARASDLEVDPEVGGFIVNAELEARSNLWIAGDAACFYDVRLGRRRIEHHDHAVISGRLAGENMTGAKKPYLHQSMFWSDLGEDVGYEAIGIVDSTLPTVGVFAKSTDKDTPLAAVTASNEYQRSTSEELANKNQTQLKAALVSQNQDDCQTSKADDESQDNYGKGVVFYLHNDIVVGVLLWNIFNQMSTARQVLARGTHYDELNEVAKLFSIHED